MDNKQMIPVKENSILYKIKRFFKSLFRFKKQLNNEEEIAYNKENIIEDNQEENNEININILATPDTIRGRMEVQETLDNNKPESSKSEMQKFLEELDGNKEKLELLSIDRLKRLDSYYLEIIKQNNDTINSMI